MGKKRDGVFPVDGDEILAADGSRWRFDGVDGGAWAQLDQPGPSVDELVELVADANGNADHSEDVRELGKAHRVWAPTFAKCPIVRSGAPRLDTSVDQAVELVARATLTDKLALVCDGMEPGLRNLVLGQLRSVLDQVEMAKVEATIRTMEDSDLMPGATPDAVRTARDELQQLGSELPTDSKARVTIAVILNPKATLPDDSRPEEEQRERGIEDAPDVLGRQLMLEGVPLELSKRMYIAAVQLVNERIRNAPRVRRSPP